MPTITLSATPKGNGYQATVTFPDDGVSISSTETYPTIAEAMTAAAMKLLDMPERLEAMDRSEPLTTGRDKADLSPQIRNCADTERRKWRGKPSPWPTPKSPAHPLLRGGPRNAPLE